MRKPKKGSSEAPQHGHGKQNRSKKTQTTSVKSVGIVGS